MRKIEVTEPNTPDWKKWRKDCDAATQELVQHVAQGGAPTITDLYKRKSIKKGFFFSPDPPFYGKCAYCEAPIPSYQHGDVEHFRPKARVTDLQDQPILLRDAAGNPVLDANGQAIPHPGYYWLAYDWRNLLPSCTKCNQPDVIQDQQIGKRNRFLVTTRHAQQPGEEHTEQPLLIHPASGHPDDDPEKHLLVDPKTGVMGHRTPRGEACIGVFALNLRDQVVADRKRACDQVWFLLNRLLQPGGDALALQELLEIQAGKRSFTMAQRAVLREAKSLFQGVLGL